MTLLTCGHPHVEQLLISTVATRILKKLISWLSIPKYGHFCTFFLYVGNLKGLASVPTTLKAQSVGMPVPTATPVVMVTAPVDSKQVSVNISKETSQTVASTLTTKASTMLPIQPALLAKPKGEINQSNAQPVSKSLLLTTANNGVSVIPVATATTVCSGVPFTSNNKFVNSSMASCTALVKGQHIVSVPETVENDTVKTNTVSNTAVFSSGKVCNSQLSTSDNSRVQSSIIGTMSGVDLLRGQELRHIPGTKNHVTSDTASDTRVLTIVTNGYSVEPRSNISCVQSSMATSTSVVALAKGQNLVPGSKHLGIVTTPLQSNEVTGFLCFSSGFRSGSGQKIQHTVHKQ